MGNINREKLPSKGIIKAKAETIIELENLLRFSYKYLDLKHSTFNLDDCKEIDKYFYVFKERQKLLCNESMQKLKATGSLSKSLRFHPIDWCKTQERKGFCFPKHDEIANEPYQFAISANEYGRVHGFIIDCTFYIVWLDYGHQLYK